MKRSSAVGISLVVLAVIVVFAAPLVGAPTEPLAAPRFDRRFWDHWSDGQAELCGYELRSPRYGHARRGRAVTIFVTETFSRAARVKTDAPSQPDGGRLRIRKIKHAKA